MGLLVNAATRYRVVRELVIVLAFFALTSALTWPYVTRLKNAVSGRNDPYLVAWTLWWDYHATFNDPLNLFHPPIFFPYRYALAFSEHCYGIALVLFPLFAFGLRPLTVHSVAIFLGFVLSGYGAFRLARTLTQSSSVAWIAGIIFAFVPYRFTMLGQLMYMFSVWIPLLFEALILFLRERSNKHAIWLGVTFFMLGLSTVSWFLWSMIPFAVIGAIYLTRHRLWRERNIWRRGAIALSAASLALAPFLLPYFIASKLYGFKRRVDEVKAHSALPMHWLVAPGPNKFWKGMGASFPDAWKFEMFPGVLPLLLPLAEFFSGAQPKVVTTTSEKNRKIKWIWILDAVIVICFAVSVLALGFDGSEAFGKVFRFVTSERILSLLSIAVLTRLCLAYPKILRRGEGRNLIETIQSSRRADAFWVGLSLTIIGFLYSLGYNTFFYRILYDLMPGFKSMRAPMRGAIFAYLGLSILGGLGVKRISERVRWGRVKASTIYVIVGLMLLIEFNAAPLYFVRGEVYPDQLTLRLKDTPMRGGIAYLPMTLDLNHQYTLRQADHLKPLITATSSFNPPDAEEIERITASGPIPEKLMDMLERIPASYLVVVNRLIPPERRTDFNTFVSAEVARGRLRYVNRFDGANDLYAVTATEPQARSERALPEELNLRDWSSLVENNSLDLLGKQDWSETIYRLHFASFGKLPHYADFMKDLKSVGNGLLPGFERQQLNFTSSLRQFAEEFTERPQFASTYRELSDAQFVEKLIANTGIQLDQSEHDRLVNKLATQQDTRAGVLLDVVYNPRFVEKEHTKATVLLHYFAFLHRNPDDPPDNNMNGFNFWVEDLARSGNREKIYSAFQDSIEYKRINQ